MKKLNILILLLTIQLFGCGQAKVMLDDTISAIADGNLSKVQKQLTGTALEQIKTQQDLVFWTEIVKKTRRTEFSVDSLHSYVNTKVLGTAYAAFEINESEIVYAQFKLECDSLFSIASDHAFPNDCKISEFGSPIVVATSFEKIQILLYAYSCASPHYQRLMYDLLNKNKSISVKSPAFPDGPRAIDVIETRMPNESGSAYCKDSYRLYRNK